MPLTLLLFLTVWWQGEVTPRFEVASIKPSSPDKIGAPSGIASGHGRITGSYVTLKRCIMGAYGIGPNEIAGGPPWLDSDRFEIAAKSEQASAGDTELMAMLRTLLAERFQLAVHRETRSVPALVLEVSKKGPKLEPASGGPATTHSGRGLIDAAAITMTRFAEVLSRQMDLPVVDNTGLKGAFNLKLEWTPERARDSTDNRPSIFAALQEQLGLRLESRKTALEILVVDHAEKPSEN